MTNITSNIFRKLNVQIKDTEVINIYRKHKRHTNSGLPPTIIVTLINSKIKQKILDSKKHIKIKNGEIIDTELNNLANDDPNKLLDHNRLIYINDHLIRSNEFLFKKARDLKRDNKIKFAWVKNGKVFIRKTDTSRVINFNNSIIFNESINE